MSSQENEIFLGAGNNITMKASKLVSTYQTLYLTTPKDGTLVLNVKIEADFDTIPEVYQEVFMNMLSEFHLVIIHFHNVYRHLNVDGINFGRDWNIKLKPYDVHCNWYCRYNTLDGL